MCRLNKDLMPKVWGSHCQKGWSFAALDKKYARLPKSPLKITAEMASPTAVNSLNLDGILTGAVIGAHPCAVKYDDFALIPLPLEILWMHNELPLWAASELMPEDTAYSSEYWHKRYPIDRISFAKKRQANTSAGRYREYRVPLRLNATNRFIAYAIGNREEVDRLLNQFTQHIGKKSAIGYGRVTRWRVEEMTESCLDIIHQNRVLPLKYAEKHGLNGGLLPRHSWTPPYWYKPLQTVCIDARLG